MQETMHIYMHVGYIFKCILSLKKLKFKCSGAVCRRCWTQGKAYPGPEVDSQSLKLCSYIKQYPVYYAGPAKALDVSPALSLCIAYLNT